MRVRACVRANPICLTQSWSVLEGGADGGGAAGRRADHHGAAGRRRCCGRGAAHSGQSSVGLLLRVFCDLVAERALNFVNRESVLESTSRLQESGDRPFFS